MRQTLKWMIAVAFGVIIGSFGIIWWVGGWPGIIIFVSIFISGIIG